MIDYEHLNKQFLKNKQPYFYMKCSSQTDKYKLAEFVYDNTEGFVMNTFPLLWENRQLWEKFQPLIYFDNTGKIIGMHAFADKVVDNKEYLKTYYIVTDKNCRGKGIAKQITLQVMKDLEPYYNTFYVNSIEGSDGEFFYKKLITKKPTKKVNEFGTTDLVFKNKISTILKNH